MIHPHNLKRFWSGVDTSGDCWTWNRYRDNNGYGRTYLYIGPNDGFVTLAHRVAWQIRNGDIPLRDGKPLNILHKCDNPPCVNPDHLFLGTQRDNMEDMHGKGRHKARKGDRGESNVMSKLTEDQVRNIFDRVNCGERQVDIARDLSITPSAVCSIIKGRCWTHLGLHIKHQQAIDEKLARGVRIDRLLDAAENALTK